jgi:hypothetical protein
MQRNTNRPIAQTAPISHRITRHNHGVPPQTVSNGNFHAIGTLYDPTVHTIAHHQHAHHTHQHQHNVLTAPVHYTQYIPKPTQPSAKPSLPRALPQVMPPPPPPENKNSVPTPTYYTSKYVPPGYYVPPHLIPKPPTRHFRVARLQVAP